MAVKMISVDARIKHLFKNPVIFGISAGIIVAMANILVATAAEGSLPKGLSMFRGYGIFTYLVPVAVTVQMGLFMYHRNIATGMAIRRSEKASIYGSALPSMTMAACCICCAYQVTGILPTVGLLLAASSFLTRYGEMIMAAGLLFNALGSILILRAILLHKKKMGAVRVYTL